MTIENLKQIAIKYATTKGSRVPLAPDELCNAVVQYFNEFLKITADINTIQVAVTEEGGNIVFTITGNTLDGKAFTPIVITVDHNDFVTNQEFEEFKTSVTKQLNNKLDRSNWSGTVYIVDSNGIQNNVPYNSNPSPNTFVYRDDNSNFVVNSPTENGNPTPKSYVDNALAGKLDKISSVSNSNQVYGKSAAGENLMYNLESHPNAGYLLQYDNDGNIYVNKGSSEYTPANMQNIADVEAQIPDTTNFADVTKANTFADVNHFTQYITSFGVEIGNGNADDDEYDVSIQESGIEIFHYISGSKANSLRITENKIMTIVYPSNEYNIFKFPNKSGTLALTTDIIKDPIYFISFYANDPSEPCHLIGTMMSKNSYGTGQKTNEEFAVMLADNLYTNSNEGLAAYGKLATKDILCIYSDDGLSIRCLDEENSEVDLPTVMFFVMETEL